MPTTGKVPFRGFKAGAIKYVVLRGFSPHLPIVVAVSPSSWHPATTDALGQRMVANSGVKPQRSPATTDAQ